MINLTSRLGMEELGVCTVVRRQLSRLDTRRYQWFLS